MKIKVKNLYKFSLIKRLKRQIISLKRALRIKQRRITYAIKKLDEYNIDYDFSIFSNNTRIAFNIVPKNKSVSFKNEKKN